MPYNYDLLIGGGGLAGNCLALALKNCGLNIAIIEARSRQQLEESPAGERALALSAGTMMILERLGIWAEVKADATAIKNIHISDQGHFGKTRLSAENQGVEALGYVIAARALETPISNMVARAGIKQYHLTHIDNLTVNDTAIRVHVTTDKQPFNLSATLLVGADGGQSTIRHLLSIQQHKRDYGQTAIITTVKGTQAHYNTAFERFTSSGPLALLPLNSHQCSVVWTRTHAQAKSLLTCSDTEFIDQLQQCFGYRLGKLSLEAPPISFPLALIRAQKIYAQRSVIIGNAAHQLHPVAGQGFNLGLRDVMQLATMLTQQHQTGQDIGAEDFLQHYAQTRQRDHHKVIGFTDSVVKIFSNQWLPLTLLRNGGLILLDHLPFAKHLLTQHAMGLAD